MKGILLALFIVVCSIGAEAQSCLTCAEPPSGELFCGETTYNGFSNCRQSLNQNGCEMWGSCTGSTGNECGTRPHCIPAKWTSGSELPQTGRWVVASVRVERSESEADAPARKRS